MSTPENQPERRTNVRDPNRPTLIELRAVFHRLWTSQVGEHGYVKRDWRELRQILFQKFKVEV